MNPGEITGFLTGALCVWLIARQNIWNWPIGISNNILYSVIFLRAGLYADAGLQVFFITLGSYGWWTWAHRDHSAIELRVTRTSLTTWSALVPATVAAALLLRYLLARYTDSVVPGWDGLTTALSLAAIYGQCRKLFESWWLWILSNLIYIPLYLYKGLTITAGLNLVYLALCIVGLRDWHRALKAQDRLPETEIVQTAG